MMNLSSPLRRTLVCVAFLALMVNAVALLVILFDAKNEAGSEGALASSEPATTPQIAPAPSAPRNPTLAFARLPSAASSGACLAWDGFARGQMGFDQAKTLLLSGPLRNKSWALQSATGPRWRLSARSTPQLAKALGETGFDAPDAKSGSQLIWAFHTEDEAREAMKELSDRGAVVSVTELPEAPAERRIAILPQGPHELAYARSLIERMPGSGLSAVACPELAGPVLASSR